MQILGTVKWNIKNCAMLNMHIEILITNNIYIYIPICIIFRGRYTCICCFRLTNVQHNKKCFARDRNTQAIVIARTPH